MTGRSVRRARITRVRTMQHMLAAAAAAQAQSHVRQLESSDAQLAALRQALALPGGMQSGAAIARIADLASRLLDARATVADSMTGARETARYLEQARVDRHIAQTSAEKLQDKAGHEERRASDKRTTAAWRSGRHSHRTTSIETKDNPQ